MEQAQKMWKRKFEEMGIFLDQTIYRECFANAQIILAQD